MKEIEFIGRVERQIYSSDNYKMFAVDVDKDKYPNIKFTVYGNCTIAGNLHSLTPGAEYLIKATEKQGQKGYLYNVVNIKKTELHSEEDVYTFLQEILTFRQASELYKFYPNIVDLVIKGEADEVVDLNKLYGIKEYTFNCIKEKIIENYALYDLINEFKGVLTISMLKKLYTNYPSIEKIRSELRIHPYTCLCNLSRVGFKTADNLLLELEKEKIIKFDFDLRTSKERCLACMMFFLEENETNGNTRMTIPELRKQVLKLTPGCAKYFVDCINENKDDIYYDKESMDIALMSTWLTEVQIAGVIMTALKKNENIWNIDWASYRNKGEFPLSDEQLSSLELVCKNSVCVLCGFAGSGKTATTNTLIKMCIDNNKTFTLCSPTGRASKVLQGYTGMPAATIHRAYMYDPQNGWGYNLDNKIDTDIVICDESSMADVFLFLHLLEGIDFSRTKLFIIGDPAQLCSVAAGSVLNDLIASEVLPVAILTKIFRYSEGGLMQVATDTRNCKQFLSKEDVENNKGFIFFGKNKDYGFLQCQDKKIIDNTSALYRKLLEKNTPNDIMVLTAQNKGDYGTANINKKLQQIANKNYGSNDFMQIGETKYYKGDIVLQTQNNYKAKVNTDIKLKPFDDPFDDDFDDNKDLKTLIANGELGIIKEINNTNVVIDFDETEVIYFKADMQNINLGYSISVHKSQGGSAKIVILLTPNAHTFMLSSNLLYVGLTRTKERCFHLGDIVTVNRAIKKKENLLRNTFLLGLLKNGKKILAKTK